MKSLRSTWLPGVCAQYRGSATEGFWLLTQLGGPGSETKSWTQEKVEMETTKKWSKSYRQWCIYHINIFQIWCIKDGSRNQGWLEISGKNFELSCFNWKWWLSVPPTGGEVKRSQRSSKLEGSKIAKCEAFKWISNVSHGTITVF